MGSISSSGAANAGGRRPTAGSSIPWFRTEWGSRTSGDSSRRTPPGRCRVGCRSTAGLTTCGRAPVIYLPRGTWHETQVVGSDESLALVVNLRVPNWADRVLDALKRRLMARPVFRATAYGMTASGNGSGSLLHEAVREVESIAPHELFADPSPYLFAFFAPTAHDRCTLTSRGRAQHVLRVYHAHRGSTELVFEDRTLARALQRVRWPGQPVSTA